MSASKHYIQQDSEGFTNVILFAEMRNSEIDRALEAAAEEEKQMRRYQMSDLKANWEESAQLKKTMLASTRSLPDYEPARLSVSSAQLLDGEDNNRADRAKDQKEQMRRWIQEQIAEKAYAKEMEKEEERRYGDMLKLIGDMRDAADREDTDLRKTLLDRANRENEEVDTHTYTYTFEYS